MDKLIFELDKEDVENKIVEALRSQVKSYATSIGLATFNLHEYVKKNKKLQAIIVEEVRKKLNDAKFMKELIKEVIQK